MFSEKLRQQVVHYDNIVRENEEEREKAFWRFMETVEPFDYKDGNFWSAVAQLISCIDYSNVDRCVHNFFCKVYSKKISFLDAVRMVKTQGQLKQDLYKPMDKFIRT